MHPIFTAELLTIDKTWKQPKCPSTEEWIKKMQYTHTHTRTHNVILINHKKGDNAVCSIIDRLDIIILSEVRKRSTDTI